MNKYIHIQNLYYITIVSTHHSTHSLFSPHIIHVYMNTSSSHTHHLFITHYHHMFITNHHILITYSSHIIITCYHTSSHIITPHHPHTPHSCCVCVSVCVSARPPRPQQRSSEYHCGVAVGA